MTSTFVSFATLFTLLVGDGLGNDVSAASTGPTRVGVVPVVDVPAPAFSGEQGEVRVGGQAARIELAGADHNTAVSAWYWLTYIDGGTRLRVFDHYAAGTRGADSEIVQSENTAWRLANKVLASNSGHAASHDLPRWGRIRTGEDNGPSAGLVFALAYIDALTPGALVGNLRVAGTGAIGPDGVVIPVNGVDVKVAAAVLARPDVVFSPTPSTLIEHTTIVESEHTRNPTAGRSVGDWLNVSGYEQAGRIAASHPGKIAFVVVHDLRQALAWLCGRTGNGTTCAIARTAASIPIGTP